MSDKDFISEEIELFKKEKVWNVNTRTKRISQGGWF